MTHSNEKKICPHCATEVKDLQVHLKNVHTKIQCSLCGILIGQGNLLKDSDNCLGAAVIQIRSLTFFFSTQKRKKVTQKVAHGKKGTKRQYCQIVLFRLKKNLQFETILFP